MVDVDKLRGIIAERNKSQGEVAKEIGISSKTFYNRMKRGVFGSDEICKMIAILDIKDPESIFFAHK